MNTCHTGLSRTMPCARNARRIVVAQTRTLQRRCNSSAISCRLAWACSLTILCKAAICSGFDTGGLPPGWTDGIEPSSERFVAIACFFDTSMACHNYVIDFVYTVLEQWDGHRHP